MRRVLRLRKRVRRVVCRGDRGVTGDPFRGVPRPRVTVVDYWKAAYALRGRWVVMGVTGIAFTTQLLTNRFHLRPSVVPLIDLSSTSSALSVLEVHPGEVVDVMIGMELLWNHFVQSSEENTHTHIIDSVADEGDLESINYPFAVTVISTYISNLPRAALVDPMRAQDLQELLSCALPVHGERLLRQVCGGVGHSSDMGLWVQPVAVARACHLMLQDRSCAAPLRDAARVLLMCILCHVAHVRTRALHAHQRRDHDERTRWAIGWKGASAALGVPLVIASANPFLAVPGALLLWNLMYRSLPQHF